MKGGGGRVRIGTGAIVSMDLVPSLYCLALNQLLIEKKARDGSKKRGLENGWRGVINQFQL